MTVDLARRGMLKALGFASTMVVGPGKALAQAAVAAAGAAQAGVASAPAIEWKTNSVCIPSAPSDIAQFAINMLSSEAYGLDRTYPEKPRASIDCFRSASPVAKARWEIEAREAQEHRRELCQHAISMIRDGKIPL